MAKILRFEKTLSIKPSYGSVYVYLDDSDKTVLKFEGITLDEYMALSEMLAQKGVKYNKGDKIFHTESMQANVEILT